MVVDRDGTILEVNTNACELFGYETDELVGASVEVLVPGSVRDRHVEDRTRYAAEPATRSMAEAQDLHGRHKDGHEIPVDIALTPMGLGDQTVIAAFVRDATGRRAAAEARQRLQESRAAQRQALELNDNVLQGLATALWQLELDDTSGATRTLDATLENARRMVADLLGDAATTVAAGDLVRAEPAPSSGLDAPPAEPRPERPRIRVLIADDAADLRLLLRTRLMRRDDVDVVGEAGDGEEVLELVDQVEPDVIIMDLSMPRVDGLQATEIIRERHPDVRIVVLSGYPSSAMEAMALSAGADEYIEKGPDLSTVEAAVRVPAGT